MAARLHLRGRPLRTLGTTDQISVNILDVATGVIRQLTKRTAAEGWPIYSPDGSSIAYWHWRDGLLFTSVNEVYVAPATGGEGKNLTRPLDRDIGKTFWMPDSKSLLVVAMMAREFQPGSSHSKERPAGWILKISIRMDSIPSPLRWTWAKTAQSRSWEVTHIVR